MTGKMNKTFFATIFCCVTLSLMAKNDHQIKGDVAEYIPIIMTELKDNHHRDLASCMVAYYYNDIIHIMFNKNVGHVSIDIYNADMDIQKKIIDEAQATLFLDISDMGSGIFYLIIRAEDGLMFMSNPIFISE